MEILLVTTPAVGGGLGNYFRHATTLPWHPQRDITEEEFMALAYKYGMRSEED
ncbi:MAG: hypothetical protein ABGY96_16610 [bacterium]